MAKANSVTKTVEKVTVVTEKEVTLVLSREEAETLRGITGSLGGYDRDNGGAIRKITDDIWEALGNAGIRGYLADSDPLVISRTAVIKTTGNLS